MNKLFFIMVSVMLLNGCGSRINSLSSVMGESISIPESRTDANGDLTGIISPELLLKKFEPFKMSFETYEPDPIAMKMLSEYKQKTVIVVVLGTWCSDSENHVGALLKVLSSLENWPYELILIGVDHNMKYPAGVIRHFHIERVPTVICLRGKKEIGRITEHPLMGLEQDLLKILTSGD